ncbi:mannan endo-1,4-beta-mannosidase 6-like [Salvia splendens]|uniref:mannan endo-1,4-beta-mannosidase 6-like n=1 Tax=Salvia splendens TaxID=180675 RepID=UPI001C25CCEA|nr:mannan endo-1,4-beta-mannosidase 6-like [Salvia splendens]
MESKWRHQKLYPILGTLGIFFLLYLNFDFHFPVVVWRLPEMAFVGVNRTRFVLLHEGRQEDFYVNGWNSYWLMQESVRAPSRRRVAEMLNRGARMGLTVCRTWAFSDGPFPNALQLRPAVFDPTLFKALDYVLVEARKQGIRVILSLVNNLNAYGGKAQYVRWAREAGINVSSSTDSFFSHPIIKGYYKAYVKAILSRKNYFSGVKYSDEPSIVAWELINEPRCESMSCTSDLQAWIAEMAAYVKSLDQKHLVTVGLEGFYSLKSNDSHRANPGKWAAMLGSDFVNNSAIKDIDFASVHAYPHSWIPEADLEAKVKYLSRWVDAHISDGENVLKKAVLFTEVGAPLSNEIGGVHDRETILKTVYNKIYESAEKREAGAGVLIWQLLVQGVDEYRDKFSFIAWKYPSTYKLILEQSCRLKNVSSEVYTRNKKDPCFSHMSR